MKRRLIGLGVILVIVSLGVIGACSSDDRVHETAAVLYVTSADQGNADGLRREDATLYTGAAFWEKVNVLLEEGPVTVNFADGLYASELSLSCIGNDRNTVTLKGQSPGGVVFDGQASVLFELKGCQNMIVESLNFTGAAPGYAFKITKYCPPEFYAQFNKENKLTAVAIKAAEGTVS